uniref:Helicase ATP-binding domain-containing protein n=1 Tax=Lactuca sativa TaxID=4236 RepID=A0A9R1VIU0_LACSA|nr:hypothetical protein LSAT_V11C500246200 [Lactuca sativa]
MTKQIEVKKTEKANESATQSEVENVGAVSLPPILHGNDVVVAAETGSGKTHGYLVPLFNKLCTTTNDSLNTDQQLNRPHMSLVLCPNVMLCEQLVRMANCICNDNGEPLLRVAAVCGRQGWPVNKPNIIVSTPAAILNFLHAIDPERRRCANFICDVKHVVMFHLYHNFNCLLDEFFLLTFFNKR